MDEALQFVEALQHVNVMRHLAAVVSLVIE
jgi:hypothetical protein